MLDKLSLSLLKRFLKRQMGGNSLSPKGSAGSVTEQFSLANGEKYYFARKNRKRY